MTTDDVRGAAPDIPPAEKRFDEWNDLKKKLHASHKTPYFREREVRWYAAGENIGREINGKGERFSRPVLIVRKYGEESFFGIPLSTKKHQGPWYARAKVRGEEVTMLLSQAGSFSAKRLFGKLDRLSEKEFNLVMASLKELIFQK